MFMIAKEENHWLDLEVKNLLKIYRLAYWGFSFFVTSTSGPVRPQSTCIAVSGVFRTIDPPPPLHQASVSSPRTKCGGYTLAGR